MCICRDLVRLDRIGAALGYRDHGPVGPERYLRGVGVSLERLVATFDGRDACEIEPERRQGRLTGVEDDHEAIVFVDAPRGVASMDALAQLERTVCGR
jgi:hypothetical protein